MTNALEESGAACDARAAGAEACFALVTAGCLLAIALRVPAGGLGSWLASAFGLAAAVFVAQFARPWPSISQRMEALWSSARLWAALATANLALSAWATDPIALAGLWLPCITAAALHWLRREPTSVAMSHPGQPMKFSTDVLNDGAIAVDQGDRLHCVEWTQSHDSKGLKCVAGLARLTFRPGERQTELHLAFCPSFASPPAFDCHQSSGPDVRIKVTQTMPYGARIELQRTDSAAWGVVSLEFSAALPKEPELTQVRRAS